jgi:hypothetical protein
MFMTPHDDTAEDLLEDPMLEAAELELEIPIDEREEIEIDPLTGEIVMTIEEESLAIIDVLPFNSNLAGVLTKEELDEIGDDIVEKVEADKESRKKWYDTFTRGLEALGIYRADDEADTGITRVTHPLLVEAATQFQARAMAELLPPGGPVKSSIVGQKTPEVIAQGNRVEAYMNFQLTVEDRGYYEERDQMMYLLPFSGSEFDKQYTDPVTGKNISRWVRCDNFIVPYDTKSLETATRYTHAIPMTHNEYRRAIRAGFYSADLLEDGEKGSIDEGDEAPLTEILTDLDGQEKPATRADADKQHVLYECHIDYDLPNFEEDIALPYIITVDSSTKKVVGIRRNWRETDETKQKRIWFTHKKFLPGFGFYGFGLLHTIGNLGEAATEILRILLDSGAFATLQGGFKSKDAKLPGDVVLEPGVWQDCEMTAEELARAFYTPPFKEPSQVLNALLGTITQLGQRFAATTETMVGDAATTGPVGTMVAQIEQGSKVFSGIHKRLHYAFGTEFIHLAELNGETLPDMYPYVPADGEQNVLRQDFDGRVDVVPVSDPNIFSSAQRIAMAQSALQLAQSMPDLADRREAAVGLLTAMRFPSPETIFPKPTEAQRLDPVSEGAVYMVGRPIKPFIEQNHAAHIQVHMGQMQGMPKERQPGMNSHLMAHMAMAGYMQMAQAMAQQGAQLPPMNWDAGPREGMGQEIPPQMEMQIAMMAAQGTQQLMAQAQQQAQAQQPQQAQPAQPNPQQDEAFKQAAFDAEEKRKQAAFDAEQQRKNMGTQSEEQRKNVVTAQEVDREDALAGISPALVKQANEFIQAAGLQMSPRELAILAKTLGRPFSEVVQAVSRMQMAGQGGGPAPIAQGINQQQARYL